MDFITINEVGPRDGLQNIKKILTVGERFQLIRSLEETGIELIEIGSFVSKNAVPAMQNTDELINKLSNINNYSVLIPNKKGFLEAKNFGVKEICTVLCVTDSMNLKNINQPVDQTLKNLKDIFRESHENNINSKCYVSVAFHCPYDGKVDASYVEDIVGILLDFHVKEIVIADTIGAANPKEVSSLISTLTNTYKGAKFSCHFHDTNALGLANVYASIESGINKFDSCIGGLGGCPYAPGATGNVATEAVVDLVTKRGYETGLDHEKLVEVAQFAKELRS